VTGFWLDFRETQADFFVTSRACDYGLSALQADSYRFPIGTHRRVVSTRSGIWLVSGALWAVKG
jgi:hypothetical protein